MSGIYVHIPFCRSRCIYCAFYSTVDMSLRQRYVDAVCREMEMRKGGNASDRTFDDITTVYLGGGTPSQLTVRQLAQLFAAIDDVYGLDAVRETTIECNPDDVTAEFAAALRELPVNRVSMGAQTFSDERLRFLRRRHTARQVDEAVGRLRLAGIGNISVDLMYGLPGQTVAEVAHDVGRVLSLGVEHVSAYCLMVEKGTALYDKMLKDADSTSGCGDGEEMERAMYELICDRLAAAGYEHYEISNFARPGRRSLHNSSYWQDVPYVGLGAAAHSYDRRSRSWNVSSLNDYIIAIEHGRLPSEHEKIDEQTHYNDLVTTALRTTDGLDLSMLSEHLRNYCLAEARSFVSQGLLTLCGSRLRLTRNGLFVSDYVMSSLMMV